MNYNFFGYNSDTPWGCEEYDESNWPKGYLYVHTCSEPGQRYADAGLILTYMRMDELRAALGRVQLEHLEERTRTRRHLTACYRELLAAALPEVAILPLPYEEADCHLMTCVLPEGCDRAAVMQAMKDAGVQTSIHYPPYHRFSWHSRLFAETALPLAEEYMRRTLTLPLHPGLNEDHIHQVVRALSEALHPRCAGGSAHPSGKTESFPS